MVHPRFSLMIGILVLLVATPAAADEAPATLVAGLLTSDPSAALREFERDPQITDEQQFFVAWSHSLEQAPDASVFTEVRDAGAVPWVRAVFRHFGPASGAPELFELELENLAELARLAGPGAVVQGVWPERSANLVNLAYAVKRASVRVTGAAPGVRFAFGPCRADGEWLRALYAQEVAAYIDVLAIAPGDGVAAAVEVLAEIDPGKPLALDAIPWPEVAELTVARLAEAMAAGISITLFDGRTTRAVTTAPLKIATRELGGTAVLDPYSTPQGPSKAWAFVREDLGLRVVVLPSAQTKRTPLVFSDRALGAPDRIDLATGRVEPLFSGRRTDGGFELVLDDPRAVEVLRLERSSSDDETGFSDEIDVSGDRQIPVDEILRRLQAREDDQARRLDHYEAYRALNLRYLGVGGSFEATYAGAFFLRTDGGFDWAWTDFSVSGVKWRSKRLPKLPLVQPEKVGSLPTEIRLDKDYDYRLRGTAVVAGRECWVIDFRPIEAVPGRTLYRGTVWVDRELSVRVRMRVSQVGLEGAVLSNEEVYHYEPLDASGAGTSWSQASYILALRITGQQTLSVLSVTLPIEIETVTSNVRINGEGFERRRQAVLASESTMVRDTDEGLRYLRKDREGERQVVSKLDSDRLFLLGGVFWDDSVDFPIPLAGVNYLDLDVGSKGSQFNLFFAGALLNGSYANPRLFGSRWNAGASLNGVFFQGTDKLYRDGFDVPEEYVKRRGSAVRAFVGRPFADFFTLDLVYRLRHVDYDRADETADDFIVPQDTLINTFRAGLDYNRLGYRLGLSASTNHRTNWEFWGLPDNDEYSPEQADYLRWRAVFAKTWWLSKFRKLAVSFEHLDGQDLDRFSGYDFGFFGAASVAGYPSGLVRGQRAEAFNITGGVNYFEKIRVEVVADAVWATNEFTGLDNELLAGIGVGGTLTLPAQFIVNFDIGYALAGPGQGKFAMRVFFLRLFPGRR